MASCAFAQHATRPEFPNRTRTSVNFEHFTKERWEASIFAKTEDMEKWQDRSYGMFVHFELTCEPENGELSWSHMTSYAPDAALMSTGKRRTEEFTSWTKEMQLEKFDADEWVAIA